MIALALNAIILFTVGMKVLVKLRSRGFRSVPEKQWRKWISEPSLRHGRIGRLMDFVTGASDLDDLGVRFAELNHTELASFNRDLIFMRRAVGTAPLFGLLGTVTGMLTTFQALASGSGGDQTMNMIASGISEALITTETGLIIAVPGLFFQYVLTRQRDRYAAFLAHLESVCTQYLCVRQKAGQAIQEFAA